jgi:hypothetical protein
MGMRSKPKQARQKEEKDIWGISKLAAKTENHSAQVDRRLGAREEDRMLGAEADLRIERVGMCSPCTALQAYLRRRGR